METTACHMEIETTNPKWTMENEYSHMRFTFTENLQCNFDFYFLFMQMNET